MRWIIGILLLLVTCTFAFGEFGEDYQIYKTITQYNLTRAASSGAGKQGVTIPLGYTGSFTYATNAAGCYIFLTAYSATAGFPITQNAVYRGALSSSAPTAVFDCTSSSTARTVYVIQ